MRLLLLLRGGVDGIARRDLLIAAAGGCALCLRCLRCLRHLLLWGAGLRTARDCRWARAHARETRVGEPEPVRPKVIRFGWGGRAGRLGPMHADIERGCHTHGSSEGGWSTGRGVTVGRRCLQPW